MLRFLIGLCLLPFAMLGLFYSFLMVVKVVDIVTHHPTVQTPVKQKGI